MGPRPHGALTRPSPAAPGTQEAAALARPGLDTALGSAALALMVLIPVVELALRPLFGRGVDNAPVLVQHLGLLMSMAGALDAARRGELTTLGGAGAGGGAGHAAGPLRRWATALAQAASALACGVLAAASWTFVQAEREGAQVLAYGLPTWWVQLAMPVGFALLAVQLGRQAAGTLAGTGPGAAAAAGRFAAGAGLALAGIALAGVLEGRAPSLAAGSMLIVLALAAGAPIFAALGALALLLFADAGLPLASVPLSHYQITVNPSLPALPLFTLAGLVLARTAAAQRLGDLFVALFGGGVRGTVVAVALLCSAFTAFTGGSGVTILALGGLLLPLLLRAGYPEQRGIGLVTSASALGVLLAPSVPLILYAVIARVPIQDMFLAGVVPALVMVACLLLFGGFLRASGLQPAAAPGAASPPSPSAGPAPLAWAASPSTAPAAARAAAAEAPRPTRRQALWASRWELAAPLVALGSLGSGLATPTESAALTAAYAVVSQALLHRDLGWFGLAACLAECARLIGGVMLILGMALALTNVLVDAGIPDAAVTWVQAAIPDRDLFLLALVAFLFAAAALMEIYAALVVLVPLLLPLVRAYGIDPVHFGIIFLAAMEAGFLCPPAGLNLYFSSAMFGKTLRYVAVAVLPALGAIFIGTLLVAWLPALSTGLPEWVARAR